MFKGVYEPSAVQQLPDGRLLITEDEPNHAFSILSIDKFGQLIEDESLDTRIITGFKRRLNDLEALARDDEGFIYALTSHSRNKKGQRSPDREHMLRFKIQNGEVLGLTSYDDLTQVLETDTKLHDLIRERTNAEVSFEEINIEGSRSDAGSGWYPMARRSAVVIAAKSSVTADISSYSFSMPFNPAERITAYARYGLEAESRPRYSMRANYILFGLYSGTRTSADRLLCPHET